MMRKRTASLHRAYRIVQHLRYRHMALRRRMSLSSALLFALLIVPSCRKEPTVSAEQHGEAQQFTIEPAHGKKLAIVAYGDVRFTDPGDTRVSNAGVRRAIVNKIADEKPDFVIFTGDL